MERTILFATGNESKAKRFSEVLLKNGIKMLTINDISAQVEVLEDGKDVIENAIKKAKAYAEMVEMPVFAMDDNLYIEGIPSSLQPGMYVRRVNGKRLTDEEMIEYYANLAHQYGKDGKLDCHWVYGMALFNEGKVSTYTWNNNDFYLVDKPASKIDSGYPLNSISIDKRVNKYFCDITKEEKENNVDSGVIDFLFNNLK